MVAFCVMIMVLREQLHQVLSRKLDLRALGYSTTGFPIQHTRLARLLRGAAFSIDPTSPEETLVVTQTGFAPGSKAATAPR
jgi:hypothetical protein